MEPLCKKHCTGITTDTFEYISAETASQSWFDEYPSWKRICLEAEQVLGTATGWGELYLHSSI